MTETNAINEQMPPPNKMGTQPINRLLITMALPMMLGMFVQSLYNIVDRVFVAYISETALAAWLLSRLTDSNAVWWAFPLADAAALFLGLYLFRRIYLKQIKPL